MRVALVGAGRVGTAVAFLLRRSGHEIVGVSSRTPDSAHAAATRLDAPTFVLTPGELIDADLVLIGVPDGAIHEVATRLVPSVRSGTVVAHLAGSLGRAPLGPLTEARTCALHPFQACPDVETAIRRLPGSAWGVTCPDPDTEAWARELIERDLHGLPVPVGEEDRALWHAAAVATSNGVAALLGAGEAILAAIDIDGPEQILGPIAVGTIANASEGGGGARTLTGPVVRGEATTVRRHMDALSQRAPELLPVYRAAARLVLESAVVSGRISANDRDALAKVVEGP